jgi:hypothetical protein
VLTTSRRQQLLKVLPLVEMLEDRVVPSWGSTPPATITPPSSYTSVNLDTNGDASGSAAITSNEIDWYKFTVGTGGSFTLDAMKATGSSVDTVAAIYTSTGTRVAYNDDYNGTTNSHFTATLTAGASYFFGVTNYTGTANGNYTWKIDGPASTGGGDDTFEENDSMAAASNLGTLASSQTYNSLKMADTQDWYKFTMNGAGTTANSVSIAFTHASGDLDMRLYNSAGTEVGSSTGTGNSETISLNGMAAGTYYVKVYGYNGALNPNYSMTINPGTGGGGGGGTNDWTIMVYVTASSLYSFANTDINEMEYAASQLPSTVKIAVFWDQSANATKYATGNGTQAAWGTAGRAILTGDTNMSSVRTTFDIVGEQNTGNPNTLVSFMQWAATNAPANNYSLILWNHGAGIYGSNFDDSDGGTMDYLTIAETATALSTTGVPQVKLMAYDACMMGMAEIGYGLRAVPTTFAASEELEPGAGHDYRTLFSALMTNPGAVTADQLAQSYVTSYGNQYAGQGPEDTYSAVRTAQYGNLATALQNFVNSTNTATAAERTAMQTARNNAIQYDGSSYVDFRDLGSFMTNIYNNTSISSAIRTAANGVRTAITNAVLAKTNDQRGSSGIAIYLPQSTMDSSYTTAFSAFNTATGWGSFCNWLVTGSRGPAGGGGGGGSRGPARRVGETVSLQVSAAPVQAPRAEQPALAQQQSEILERLEADASFAQHQRTHRASQKVELTPAAPVTNRSTTINTRQSFEAWKTQMLTKHRRAAASNTFANGFDRVGSLASTLA